MQSLPVEHVSIGSTRTIKLDLPDQTCSYGNPRCNVLAVELQSCQPAFGKCLSHPQSEGLTGCHAVDIKPKTKGFQVKQASAELVDTPKREDVALFLHTSGTTSRPKVRAYVSCVPGYAGAAPNASLPGHRLYLKCTCASYCKAEQSNANDANRNIAGDKWIVLHTFHVKHSAWSHLR